MCLYCSTTRCCDYMHFQVKHAKTSGSLTYLRTSLSSAFITALPRASNIPRLELVLVLVDLSISLAASISQTVSNYRNDLLSWGRSSQAYSPTCILLPHATIVGISIVLVSPLRKRGWRRRHKGRRARVHAKTTPVL